MAKRTHTPPATEDLVEPKVNTVTQQGAPISVADIDKLEIPGFKLRWVNPGSRNTKGWGHWRPVEVDSEIGKTVMATVNKMGELFGGLNLDTNYIYMSANTMLAYARVEDVDAYRASVNARITEISKAISSNKANGVRSDTMLISTPAK